MHESLSDFTGFFRCFSYSVSLFESFTQPEGRGGLVAEMRVVLHMDEPEEKRFAIGLTNLENLVRAAGGPAHVNAHFVVNGPGVLLFRTLDKSLAQRVFALSEAGVHFVACQNALKGNDMGASDLPVGIKTVPAGILELVRLQQEEGCAYVKP